MFIIYTGIIFTVFQFLIREGSSAAANNEIPNLRDAVKEEEMKKEMQEKQNAVLQQQNQQLQQRNAVIQQQMPMQPRNAIIPPQMPPMQLQNQMTPQQMAMQQNSIMQQNAIMQQNQMKQNAIPRPYPPHLQVPPITIPIPAIKKPLAAGTPKTIELLLKKDETDADKAEKANEALEKLLQFLTIMGQVDTYLSEKAQTAIKAIAKIADDSNGDKRLMF